MPSSSFSVFDNAEPLELSAVNSFSLRDPDRVWFVQEGAIDIFLQDISEGTLEGPRHYLTRITAGQAVFGFAAASEFRVAIVASPAPDTRVLRMSMEQLRSGLAEDPPEPHLIAMVNQWIINLAQLASDSTAPKRFTEIRAGEQVPPGEGNRIIAPRDGVLWVRHAAGQSSFLGKKTVPASEDTFFPVSKSGWLEAPPDTQPEIVATEYIAFADPDWRGLQLFQKLILECIVAKRKQAEEGEQQRLRAKADATGSMVHGALCWLASALDKSRENPPEQEERGSPLLRACRRVGRVLGLDIVPPPDLDSNRYKDPVFGIARASSVRARKVMLRENWWREDGGPLVAFRAHDDRPVALVPTSGARYNVYDPVDGTTNRVTAKVAATLSATAYCFYRPFPDKLMTLKDLMLFGAANCRRDIVTVLLMGLGGGILSLLGPIAVAILFDYAIPGAQREDVRAIAIFLLVSSSSTALFSVTRSFSVLRMQGKLDAVLQAAAWDRLLRLPAPFFRQYNSGDLAIRSMAFKEIGQALSGPFLSLVITQLFSLLSIVLLFVYSWQLALIAMALVLTAMGVSAICLRINLKHSRELSKIRGRIAGIVLELVNGVPKFRVSGAEAKAFSVWARVAGDRRRTVRKARYSAIALWVFNASWPVFCSGVLFYFAADLVNAPGTSTLSTGRFLAFFSVFNQVVHSALWFAVSLMPVLGIVPLYERAKPILDATPEARKATAHPGELTGAIEVSGLNFRYTPDGPLVLRDMSFSIEPGSMVAIVGSSGCGKSTLFRLLLGFEKPESGGIFFDGQDLAGLDVQAVRQQMGVVLQNAKLGSGSLVNLIIGSAPLTIDDAWEAARMTGLEKDIASMPMGMHTAISDGAGTLSGGQRQRLTIARAIVNRPRIILFDEATSALDNETQAVVTRSLEKLRATRIVIAHRLSTITNADRILVLDSGNVVQSGRYEELMAQPGPFRELASRQIA